MLSLIAFIYYNNVNNHIFNYAHKYDKIDLNYVEGGI